MNEKKRSNLNLTELILVKAGNDWNRCYYGTIRRDHDEHGNPIIYGKIQIGSGYIYATAPDQWELGKKLDEMVHIILDYNLPKKKGNRYQISLN